MSEYFLPLRRRAFVALSVSTTAIAWTGLVAMTFATPTHADLGRPGAANVLAPRPLAASRRHSAFDWAGVFDVIGTGFPDGERRAVMAIGRQDSAYVLRMLQGPPGELTSMSVAGDSAYVVWNLGPEEMLINLRGIGDSLMGEWSTSHWRGDVRGVRRR